MTVDDSLLQRFERMRRAREEARAFDPGDTGGPLERGGGGGDSGGMDGLAERVTRVEVRLDGVEHRLGAVEQRMDRLESRMDGLDTRLRAVEQSLASLNAKVDLLTTQIVAKLPSWWQMPAVIGSTVALLAALWAAGRFPASRGLLPP